MIHHFPEEIVWDWSTPFTDPFRYAPHKLVSEAAELTMKHIRNIDSDSMFAEGKMIGVLVVKSDEGIGYICAFSGNIDGKGSINGFVPPIFDLTIPGCYFKVKEMEITKINDEIASLESSPELQSLESAELKARAGMAEDIERQKARMALLKHKRDEIRCENSDPSGISNLIKESQYEKAELKRIRNRWMHTIEEITSERDRIASVISDLKEKRKTMSDELQKWIFKQYIVYNSSGEGRSIYDIFSDSGVIPPGGTGDCAAPKLLNYAFTHGLTPLAMGEFWYGESPETAVRTHGHFYPSCTSKCGPLLKYMLSGMSIQKEEPLTEKPEIIDVDEQVIIVAKPSGMPSVPGLDGKESLLENLRKTYPDAEAVHRLDMDTSGIMIFARDAISAKELRRQFEEHTITKSYLARLSPAAEGRMLHKDDRGRIVIPLGPDYDERPRQKVDNRYGKEAITDYHVIEIRDDGLIEIMFHPETGRTHQLRVHSAHITGLGHPIEGDMLYGGQVAERLSLHAYEISFIHPSSGKSVTYSSGLKCYK